MKFQTFTAYGPSDNCFLKCGGNESQICGGYEDNSVYSSFCKYQNHSLVVDLSTDICNA